MLALQMFPSFLKLGIVDNLRFRERELFSRSTVMWSNSQRLILTTLMRQSQHRLLIVVQFRVLQVLAMNLHALGTQDSVGENSANALYPNQESREPPIQNYQPDIQDYKTQQDDLRRKTLPIKTLKIVAGIGYTNGSRLRSTI